MTNDSRIHSSQFRVYYEDTDAEGIVYHANYLRFAERARTEMLRDGGISRFDMDLKDHMGFVVRHMDIDFKAPARLDDIITVHSYVEEIANTSFTMGQQLFCDAHTKKLCVFMTCVLVCIDLRHIKPVRMPEPVRTTLKRFHLTDVK